ncbi:MAG: cupin domain-containing protein [Thermomicrobiales bacterium]
MQYFRIYAGPDGESHFEEITIEMRGQSGGSAYSALVPATGVIFRRSPADQLLDWHPAPRRQFVITLSGAAEVEASDGEVRQFGPGTILLADDTTGKGHITRGRGNEERLSLFIPLPDER